MSVAESDSDQLGHRGIMLELSWLFISDEVP